MLQSAESPNHLAACIELAGFAAAQAMCCLFDRVPFASMGFSRTGQRHVTLTLLPGGTAAQMSATIQQWLAGNPAAADAAVVVCDAFITMGGVKTDALVVQGRSYAVPACDIKIAVPYRPHHHPRGFAIHRPKFIVESVAAHDRAGLTQAFFKGVFSHEAGRRVWDACADESR